MDYKKFLETITRNLQLTLGQSCHIEVCPVQKNNNVTLDGLRISHSGQICVPTIYMNAYFDAYQEHAMNIEEILDDILGLYQNSVPPSCLGPEFLNDFDSLKSRIMYRIIHTESNQALLSDLPSIRFLDLSVVFFLYIEENASGHLTALIRKEHLRQWKVGVSDLWKLARINTPDFYPPVIQNMNDMIGSFPEHSVIHPDPAFADTTTDIICADMNSCQNPDIFSGSGHHQTSDLVPVSDSDSSDIFPVDALQLYVITNTSGLYGASCILYPDVLENLASRLNHDLLILPSSIHEVLVLPADTQIHLAELRAIVCAINQTEVPPEDRLSDQIYFYRREDGMLELLPDDIIEEDAGSGQTGKASYFS